MFPSTTLSSDPFWGPIGANVVAVPTNPFNDDVSTHDTLRIMAVLARKDAASPQIQSLSQQLLIGCTTPEQFFQAVWYYVHQGLQFQQHEDLIPEVLNTEGWDKQLLISPLTLLLMPEPKGDCAVFSTLVASILTAAGVDCLYKVIAADSSDSERWSHVYVVIPLGKGDYYTMDTSHGKYPGWEHKLAYKEGLMPV